MKRIALIGASGFVGSAILHEALKRNLQINAIVRNPLNMTVTSLNLTVKKADVMDEEKLVQVLSGNEAVISAYNPGWKNPHIYEDTLEGYSRIIKAAKKAKVKRLLIVGGAGSLYVEPNKTLIESGGIPESILPGVQGLADVYYKYLKPEKDIDWVFFSPAASLTPGKRTGKYRLGKDDMIFDANGESSISVEDYAEAMLDELEKPAHHQERFTIGY